MTGLSNLAWAAELTRWASDIERRISAIEEKFTGGTPDRNGH